MRTPTTHPHRRTPLLTAILVTALIGAATLAQAQGGTASDPADTTVDRPARTFVVSRGAVMMPSGPARMHGGAPTVLRLLRSAPQPGVHYLGRGAALDPVDPGAAFARWLERTPSSGPVVPGLVGHVADGTEVRLHLYDGDPADDGALLTTLTYRAGSDDLSVFQAEVRASADGATHVVIDVLGRTVALPEPSTEGDGAD